MQEYILEINVFHILNIKMFAPRGGEDNGAGQADLSVDSLEELSFETSLRSLPAFFFIDHSFTVPTTTPSVLWPPPNSLPTRPPLQHVDNSARPHFPHLLLNSLLPPPTPFSIQPPFYGGSAFSSPSDLSSSPLGLSLAFLPTRTSSSSSRPSTRSWLALPSSSSQVLLLRSSPCPLIVASGFVTLADLVKSSSHPPSLPQSSSPPPPAPSSSLLPRRMPRCPSPTFESTSALSTFVGCLFFFVPAITAYLASSSWTYLQDFLYLNIFTIVGVLLFDLSAFLTLKTKPLPFCCSSSPCSLPFLPYWPPVSFLAASPPFILLSILNCLPMPSPAISASLGVVGSLLYLLGSLAMILESSIPPPASPPSSQASA